MVPLRRRVPVSGAAADSWGRDVCHPLRHPPVADVLHGRVPAAAGADADAAHRARRGRDRHALRRQHLWRGCRRSALHVVAVADTRSRGHAGRRRDAQLRVRCGDRSAERADGARHGTRHRTAVFGGDRRTDELSAVGVGRALWIFRAAGAVARDRVVPPARRDDEVHGVHLRDVAGPVPLRARPGLRRRHLHRAAGAPSRRRLSQPASGGGGLRGWLADRVCRTCRRPAVVPRISCRVRVVEHPSGGQPAARACRRIPTATPRQTSRRGDLSACSSGCPRCSSSRRRFSWAAAFPSCSG